jgi:hypothetical protein
MQAADETVPGEGGDAGPLFLLQPLNRKFTLPARRYAGTHRLNQRFLKNPAEG